ncbi:TPA: HNH endonuclease [Klebsiella pneumoniae]|nr:HNH endonuclease [Klebsiella pneumoniae]
MARVSMFNKSEIDYMTEEQKLARWPNALKLKREIERRREEEFKGKFPTWKSKVIHPYKSPAEKVRKPIVANPIDLDIFKKVVVIDNEFYQMNDAQTGELTKCTIIGAEKDYPRVRLYEFHGFKSKYVMAHRAMAAYYEPNQKLAGNILVDHRNGDRRDYRAENLRLVTVEQNAHNRPEDRDVIRYSNSIDGNTILM